MNVPYDKAIKIVDKYGVTNQKYKAAEELSELMTLVLQDANCKGKVGTEHITEEIADVYVMLKQLEAIYFLDDRDLQQFVDFKMERALKENRSVRWEEEAKAEANLHRG